MHFDPAPGLPKVVILDVSDCVEPFREAVEKLYHLGIETDVALADMLDAMHRQDHAQMNVEVSGEDMVSSVEGTDLLKDVEMYVNARNRLSMSILGHLNNVGLYVRNVLYYQLRELKEDNGTLILQKLEVPLTDGELRARHIARQADTAHRRYIPRPAQERETLRTDVQPTGYQIRVDCSGSNSSFPRLRLHR